MNDGIATWAGVLVNLSMGQYTVKELKHADVFPITLSFCSCVWCCCCCVGGFCAVVLCRRCPELNLIDPSFIPSHHYRMQLCRLQQPQPAVQLRGLLPAHEGKINKHKITSHNHTIKIPSPPTHTNPKQTHLHIPFHPSLPPKVLTTPVVVVLQNVMYGVDLPAKLKLALVPVCVGVALATVNDFSFNMVRYSYSAYRGITIAIC